MASTYVFLKLGFKCQLRETWMKVKKNSEVTGYFHNFGTLEQVHCGH